MHHLAAIGEVQHSGRMERAGIMIDDLPSHSGSLARLKRYLLHGERIGRGGL